MNPPTEARQAQSPPESPNVETAFRIPTDPTEGLASTPFQRANRTPSPDIRPFPERSKSPLSQHGRIVADYPGPWSDQSSEAGGQPPVHQPNVKKPSSSPQVMQRETSPTLVTMGSESLKQLVAHMDVNKPAKAGVYNGRKSAAADVVRYRTYNGLAVQTLSADLPLPQTNTGFPNRRNCSLLQKQALGVHFEDVQEHPDHSSPPPKVTLDGFMLLGATHEPMPGNMQTATVASRGITDVEAADMKYFTNLRHLDISDNNLQDITCFSQLPELKCLILAVNQLSHLGNFPEGAFDLLEVLDLSFNLMSAETLLSRHSPLSRLPRLMELNISGNNLRKLPLVLGSFPSLSRLHASQNDLQCSALRPLCALKRLKYVDLSWNKIKEIPDRAACDGAFPCLEVLDLSHNYIRSRKDISAMESVSALKRLILAGNPILINRRTGIQEADPGAAQDIENQKPNSTNSLACKVQSHSTYLQRPQLGPVYAHKTLRVNVEDYWNVDELAASVIPVESGERIVAAFQRVQAQIEGWRGPDAEDQRVTDEDEEEYEDKTFLTGVHIEGQLGEDAVAAAQSPDPSMWAWSEIEDPTVQMACALGMDPKTLPIFTGKHTTNMIGAVNALKFALNHPLAPTCEDGDQVVVKGYMKMTETAARKRDLTQAPVKQEIKVELPPTPTTKKIQTIEDVLDNMKRRLKVAENKLVKELCSHKPAQKRDLPASRSPSPHAAEIKKILDSIDCHSAGEKDHLDGPDLKNSSSL